jgi:hypothetical protein
MATFPSKAWFEAVGERVEADREHFKKLGYFDAKVGVAIDANGHGKRGFVLDFFNYGVKEVSEVADPMAVADFVIEGDAAAWTEMVRNIQEHGEADLGHTLNRLTMAGVPMRVVARDQLEIDVFYRFNQSLQAFFNEAAGVPTEFAVGG